MSEQTRRPVVAEPEPQAVSPLFQQTSPETAQAGLLGNSVFAERFQGVSTRPSFLDSPLLTNPLLGGGWPMFGQATPTTAQQPQAQVQQQPQATPFVDQTNGQKVDTLANLFGGSRDLLTANGVSQHMESKLAASMMNESGRNEARRFLGNRFMREANGLDTALRGVDRNNPEAMARATRDLTEEQRFLLGKVQAGTLDLSQLSSEDPEVQRSLRNQVTEAGIELRANQYQEMSGLQNRQRAGETLTREETARMTRLERQSGIRDLGFAGNMGSLHGMSRDRFAEIYEEGQQRFEPVQYRALRDSYARNKARNDASPDPSDTVEARAGIGRFQLGADQQAQLATNNDLIADMATSYGSGQIMGAYAVAGLLRSQNVDGTDHTTSLEELKGSADRLTPNATDIQTQIGFLNMKGIRPDNTTMTNDTFTRRYNGSRPGSELYTKYMRGLENNGPAYDAARARLPPRT